MRPERLYLVDMLMAADAIMRFLEGMNREAFVHDELRQSAAVLQKLVVVGEAVALCRDRSLTDIPIFRGQTLWPFGISPSMSILP